LRSILKYSSFKTGLILSLLLYCVYLNSQEVVINEVLTSPAPGSGSTGINANSLYNLIELPPDNREWIELYNPHPCDTVDISCYVIGSNMYSLTAGSNWGSFTFPSGTIIPPLGFIIVGGNSSQVPVLDFNINDYVPTLGTNYLDGDTARWFLRDSWGWIAIYDQLGDPVDAVFWSQVYGPSDLYVQGEYSHNIVTRTSCSGTISLLAAVNIPDIEFAGFPQSSSTSSLQRIMDADSIWYSNPQVPTPRACNAKCVKPPLIDLVIINSGCGNNNGSLIANIINGGTGPYTIAWNTGQSNDTLTGLQAGIYIITVTDFYSCFIVTDSAEILDIPAPELQINNVVHETCSEMNASAEVIVSNGTSPFTFLWNSNPPQTTAVIDNIGSGTYIVSVTDFNGCTSSESIVITNHHEPEISVVDVKNDICGIGSGSAKVVVLEGTPPFEYTWSTVPPQFDSIVSNLSPGMYTVSVSDGICTVTAGFNIYKIPAPVADFSFNPEVVYINNGKCRFTDLSTPVVFWSWDFGDGSTVLGQNPVHKYYQTGEFLVTLIVRDANDCYDSVQKYVPVREKTSIFVPNAFTPNANGRNDNFKAYGINVLDFEMNIFSRWGDQIFYSNDIETGWDGMFKGDPLPADVYVYLILYTQDNGKGGFEGKRLVGKVVLLR